MKIDQFIKELNDTDRYIKHIYSQGGCYRFHVLLSKLYKNTTPYIKRTRNHVITKYKNKYYDIFGEVTDISNYREFTPVDYDFVNQWSFHKHNKIMLAECPHCDEPLTYDP